MMSRLATPALVSVLVVLCHLFVIAAWGSSAAAQEPLSNAGAVTHAKALSQAFRQAASQASPAVVTVISKVRIAGRQEALRQLLQDPRFRQLFPEGQLPDEPEGNEEGPDTMDNNIGSGVIINPSGLVLTNNHVVQDADQVVVRLSDGREFEVESIRSDSLSDLAVIQLSSSQGELKSLPAARMGDSDNLAIGDWVIAIGSPFELELTVSAGIISGKGRGISKIRRGRLLQTDAAINPGNSGGPLVNLDGEVVGINTAIATSSGGYQGIGFAIPINRAKWVVRELVKHGKVRRAYLGIRIAPILPEDARRLRTPTRSGVLIVGVLEESPAADAGLKRDDVIVSFAGQRVRAPRDLQDIVEQKPLDSQQEVEVLRNGKRQTLTVVVKPLPEDSVR